MASLWRPLFHEVKIVVQEKQDCNKQELQFVEDSKIREGLKCWPKLRVRGVRAASVTSDVKSAVVELLHSTIGIHERWQVVASAACLSLLALLANGLALLAYTIVALGAYSGRSTIQIAVVFTGLYLSSLLVGAALAFLMLLFSVLLLRVDLSVTSRDHLHHIGIVACSHLVAVAVLCLSMEQRVVATIVCVAVMLIAVCYVL